MSSSCSSTTTTNTADRGGGTVITSLHSDIIQTHILNRLDGPTLASTSCGSSQLYQLCKEENLWKKICSSYWPSISDPRVQDIISSFPSGHHSFFSDSYPALNHHHPCHLHNSKLPQCGPTQTSELISAVDIHYGNQLIYSKVVVTQTLTDWFMTSPLRFDLLNTKEIVPTQVKFDGEDGTCMASIEENMKLSWIIIDPATKKAVNLSSLKPVQVQWHWLTGEIQVLYSTVMATGIVGQFVNCGVMVTCSRGEEGGDLHVREISMQIEDMEGKTLCGKDSLVILREAMEMERKKGNMGEAKKRYEMFLEMRRIWRGKRQERERRLDLVCVATGVTIFLAFSILILFR